ncbi:MAG: phage tail tape measure protein [Thermoprotei archaeon]|nr:MAG: phage tail tape measure protein [Thermoprotei archaeon]
MQGAKYIITAEATMKGIPEVQKALVLLEQEAKRLGVTAGKISMPFKTSTGKMITATAELTKNGINPLRVSIQEVNKSATLGSSIMGQYQKALMRVAIVVPIWQAFRTLMMTISTTIREGYEQIKKLSAELLRASAVIHNTALTTGDALDILRNKVKKLSVDSGESMDRLANSFYRFGTVGNNFENSLAGMQAALKTSMAMQGDLTAISKTMALTYKLLGDSMDSTLSPLKRQELMGAQLFKLYRTNAFEINEMASALQQFLPTANTANFTYAQTISLLGALQSAGLKSSRSGRLLRTSISKLVQNLDILASQLGLAVNPELDTTFDVLMRVLSAIHELDKSGKRLPIEKLTVLKEIFGGVRTQEAGKAMVATLELIRQNLSDVAGGTANNNKLLEEYNVHVKRVEEDTSTLMKRNENLKKIIGETFLTGITGANNFNEAMKTVNTLLQDTAVQAKGFGGLFRVVFFGLGTGLGVIDLARYDAQIVNSAKNLKVLGLAFRGLKGELSRQEISQALRELTDPKNQKALKQFGIGVDQLIKNLIEMSHQLENKEAIELQMRIKFNKAQIEKEIEEKMFPETKLKSIKLPVDIQTSIENYDRQLKLVKEQLNDTNQLKLAEKDLTEFVKEKVRYYNSLKNLKERGLSTVTEEFVVNQALKGNYLEIVKAMGEVNANKQFLLELLKKAYNYNKAYLQTEKEIAETNKKRMLERLSAQGATEIQIAEKRVALARTQKELEEALFKLEIAHLKEIESHARTIRGIFKASFRDALDTGDLNEFFSTFKEKMRNAIMDSVAEGLTNQLMNFTDLDIMLGKGLDTLEMERAITTSSQQGANFYRNAILSASQAGAQSFAGIGAGGGLGAGALGGLAGGSSTAKKKPDFFGAGGGFSKMLGAGLLAFSLLGGTKGSSRISQAFRTDPNAGRTTTQATTRATTIAKVNNIVLNVNVNMDGTIEDPQNIEEIARVVGEKVKTDVLQILNESNVATGNI